jgi:hypothetical protein
MGTGVLAFAGTASYRGEAINPQNLSLYERARGIGAHYAPEFQRGTAGGADGLADGAACDSENVAVKARLEISSARQSLDVRHGHSQSLGKSDSSSRTSQGN